MTMVYHAKNKKRSKIISITIVMWFGHPH